MPMPDAFEELVGSLLWEGYALYPYTRGSAKNATPTPFGIVYPQVYADAHRRSLRQPRAARASRSPAPRRRSPPRSASCRRADRATRPRSGASRSRRVRSQSSRRSPREQTFEHGDLRVRRAPLGRRRSSRALRRRRCSVEQHDRVRCHATAVAARRSSASLLSTLPFLRLGDGRFASPLEWTPPPARTRSRCSRPPRTTCCSGPRSCFPSTRRSRRRARGTCSTAPRSRRRSCCTCWRCPTTSARRSPRTTPPCAR